MLREAQQNCQFYYLPNETASVMLEIRGKYFSSPSFEQGP